MAERVGDDRHVCSSPQDFVAGWAKDLLAVRGASPSTSTSERKKRLRSWESCEAEAEVRPADSEQPMQQQKKRQQLRKQSRQQQLQFVSGRAANSGRLRKVVGCRCWWCLHGARVQMVALENMPCDFEPFRAGEAVETSGEADATSGPADPWWSEVVLDRTNTDQ